MRLKLLPMLLLVAGAASAHAALFSDDEARKAILDLRARVTQNEEQAKARQAELTAQIQQLQRSLLELNNQLERLRGDLAAQRGQNEQLARDVADLQRRQKDIAQGVDDRMRKFEPQSVSLDGKDFLADPDEKRMYDEAIAQLRSGDFVATATSLNAFLRRYPASGYVDSARFWLGNALYGKRDYREAVATFRTFVATAPQHPRAPEAMLAMANSQLEMKDAKSARVTLNELVKNYPQSEAAQAGRERLAALK
jgi:tol-pal system protein YbgF